MIFTQQTALEERNASLSQTVKSPLNNLESFTITLDEAESTLLSLSTGKASGPDLVINKILKDLAQLLSLPLKDLFNFSFEKGNVPIIWKHANSSLIFKTDDPSEESNYRPFLLLSTVGKVLERNVRKHVLNVFKKNTS